MSATARCFLTRAVVLLLFCLVLGLSSVSAQSQSQNSSASASASASRNVTVVLTTSTVTATTVSQSGGQAVNATTVYTSTYNVTVTPTASPSASASASATPTPIVLATTLDPAFGVLGAILIITGLPSAFWGHKNRWTSFFLIGFYTLSLVCIVLILKFGVLSAVNPPNKTLRGMFVLASVVAGIAGGGGTIFFWKTAKYCIGGWGGFAFGLWIQCFRDGGLISPIGLRWVLYIVCAVIGFVLCTIPKIHYYILLFSTAFVGASSVMLGIDCFTTAGLKEFYIWNLGFRSLFPKFVNHGIAFPVTQTMQIELGLLGALALAGVAVQFRILTVLRTKLKEIQLEQRKRDDEAELRAAERFATLMVERDQWEREHPTLAKHGRSQSGYSSMPLMKDHEFPSSSPDPTTPGGLDEKRGSTFTLTNGGRPRYQSGISDFMAAPTSEEEMRRVSRHPQNPGVLPALDLGLGIEDDLPQSLIVAEKAEKGENGDGSLMTPSKEDLLAEIQNIRRSIDLLNSESRSIASAERSRHPSLSSRRTLSQDLGGMLSPTHLRPPRQADPRGRVQSLEFTTLSNADAFGASIGRPTSAPLREDNWDAYVRDRKLLQPPSGITAPIPTTPILPAAERIAMPPAVAVALETRKRRESALELGEVARANTPSNSNTGGDPEDAAIATLVPAVSIPVAPAPAALSSAKPRQERKGSSGPITILPPRRQSQNIAAPIPERPTAPRTYTFEELTDRHREKMRGLQGPVTQAEREYAELEAAKERWERSKAAEKEAVTRRQAEKAAQLAREEKKRKASEVPEREGHRSATREPGQPRHSRSLSADKLGTLPPPKPSRRLSTLKVEDWQREQQQGGGSGKRDSRAPRAEKGVVPFPEHGRPRDSGQLTHDRRRNSAMGFSRDPPS